MDIFRFLNPTAPTKMEQGVFINELLSKMWVERYLAAGEFRLTAKASSGAREALPLGSFISHTDTTEIMIVENHEILDVRGEDPQIVITGRGLETILESRIVGSQRFFPNTGSGGWTMSNDFTRNQVRLLIRQHIDTAFLLHLEDEIPYITPTVSALGGVAAEREVPNGDLYLRVVEILAEENLGIRVIRPGLWSPLGAASPNVALDIHAGVDRTDEVIFSYDTGEIESSDYLWSRKLERNSALVRGRWVETRVDTPGVTNYNRRMMYVEATDVDEAYSEAPVGGALDEVAAKLEQRGRQALAAANGISLTKTEVSQDYFNMAYRKDFNVGDLISVSGGYEEVTNVRRITEFVEIEDETGRKAYPTLTMD